MTVVYLNNAASSWPKAPGVVDAVQAALLDYPEHPGRVVTAHLDPLTECRQLLAGLLGAPDPNRVILTMNATHALNLAIQGLELTAGHCVVTTVTEHNSVLRPLNQLHRDRGVELKIVGLAADGAIDAAAFAQAMALRPALVAINHASNVTGRINDVAALFSQAHQHGAVTLLDASQSLGHIPVIADELGADLVAFTGHKGLLGPPGCGGLYVRPGLELRQLITGGTGIRSDLPLHPVEMPLRHEAGTQNLPAYAGLAAAIRWLQANGPAHQAQGQRLAGVLRNGLAAINGVRVLDSADPDGRTGVVSFLIDGWPVADAEQVLRESYGLVCRAGLHCAPLIHRALGCPDEGSLRLSVSGFNTEEEIAIALQAVGRLAESV